TDTSFSVKSQRNRPPVFSTLPIVTSSLASYQPSCKSRFSTPHQYSALPLSGDFKSRSPIRICTALEAVIPSEMSTLSLSGQPLPIREGTNFTKQREIP